MRGFFLVSTFLILAIVGTASAGKAGAQPYVRMPLTIVSAPAPGDTGLVTPARFATHGIRPSRGIVLDAEVRQGRKVIPAGTVLARIETGSGLGMGSAVDLYCDVRPLSRWSSGDLPCFSDRDSDGLLDHAASALTSPAYFVMGVNAVRGNEPLAVPVAFHEALPTQMPTSQFALRHCVGAFAGLTFEITAPLNGSDWQIGRPPCPLVPRLTSDGAVIEFHDLRVRIADGPGGTTWTILSVPGLGAELSLSVSQRPY